MIQARCWVTQGVVGLCALGAYAQADIGGGPALCSPDPWTHVCAEVDPLVKQAQVQGWQQAMGLLAAWQAPPLSPQVADAWFEPRRPALMVHVAQARTAFVAALATVEGLRAQDGLLDLVSQAVVACSQQVRLWPSTQLNGASVQNTDPRPLIEHTQLPPGACYLYLPPRYVVECQQGTPNCYRMLFHEMAHSLNACRMHQMAAQWRDDGGDDATAARLERYADGLAALTACVAQGAAVFEGIKDTCRLGDPVDEVVVQRCSYTPRTREHFPSQWEEAEADAWSALAWSRWLQTTYAEPEARRMAVAHALQAYCAEAGLQPVFGRDPVLEVDTSLPWWQPPSPAQWLARTEERVMGCRRRSRVPVEGVVRTEHPRWPHRWNGWILQSSHLRRTLGCPDPPRPQMCLPLTVESAD